MSRKPKRGYYVKGHFVPEGSELDLELKAELKGTTEKSRTDLKRESDALQALGEQLLTLRADLLAGLNLSEKLLDADTLQAAQAALDFQLKGSADDRLALHLTEQWRDRLVAEDSALTEWLALEAATPQAEQTDPQHLRALIRQARKDAQAKQPPESAGAAVRHGRAYRDIFQIVKAVLAAQAAGDDGNADADDHADSNEKA